MLIMDGMLAFLVVCGIDRCTSTFGDDRCARVCLWIRGIGELMSG